MPWASMLRGQNALFGQSKNCAQRTRQNRNCAPLSSAEGYSSTGLPGMAFLPGGVDYFDTGDVDWGYAPSWARDAADYIEAKTLPVELQ